MNSPWLRERELIEMGFLKVGREVCVSRRASIHGAEKIEIGDRARIDDFCILSAGDRGIRIGRYVHIAVSCSLIGKGRITLDDFSGLSARVTIYSSSDDFSGRFMTNPTVPDHYTNVRHADVTLDKHVIVGAGAVILPGTHLATGAALGALALAKGEFEPFAVYAGVPARKVAVRKQDLLALEAEFEAEKRLDQ